MHGGGAPIIFHWGPASVGAKEGDGSARPRRLEWGASFVLVYHDEFIVGGAEFRVEQTQLRDVLAMPSLYIICARRGDVRELDHRRERDARRRTP